MATKQAPGMTENVGLAEEATADHSADSFGGPLGLGESLQQNVIKAPPGLTVQLKAGQVLAISRRATNKSSIVSILVNKDENVNISYIPPDAIITGISADGHLVFNDVIDDSQRQVTEQATAGTKGVLTDGTMYIKV